ncbi:MAG: YafY family transcriptional regulator [Thermomicrobiales bacterium]|jgi:predicted DNA-binding transcriptional regulator YafY|nr:YafY family transcriptional regulator [Thermomicrobiales bacterium]
MNRIDRLFGITTHLQARGHLRAADLADIYEVSIRTIYRDIAALSESGVPIVSLPGRGYSLVDGYFLPPLLLSTREATALVIGARLLAGQASTDVAEAAEESVAKILAVMSDDARRELRQLDDVLDFAMSPQPREPLDVGEGRVRALGQAILERRLMTIRYFGRNRGQQTVRKVEPLRLGYANGAWYLTAYCRDRQEERAFRLDRIERFEVESETFRARPATQIHERPVVDVIVRFRRDIRRWVRERQHWSFVSEETIDDELLVCYRPGDLDEIANWLLGWGTAAEVIAPRELRYRLRDEARGLLEMLT